MSLNRQELQSHLSVARGDQPADLVLKNARIVNTLSSEIEEGSVAVYAGQVCGIGDYAGRQEVDLRGAYLAPSFVDGHIHIESSALTPAAFAQAVVVHGTGAVITDPHEIANVCGVRGIQYMLKAAEDLPIDIFVNLPSCVPATELETSGAGLTAADLQPFLTHPRVLGLAELMNYPGVIAGDAAVLDKIMAARSRPRDGHAPHVRGHALNAYIAAGIETDHECTTLAEAREKLRRGLVVQIREGSSAKNLAALCELIDARTAHRLMFVSDDRHADDLVQQGHMNAILRKAVTMGVDPLLAVRMVTLHPAKHYGLQGIGAIAPGYLADFVELDNLTNFRALRVWKRGKLVAENGRALANLQLTDEQGVTNTVHLAPLPESCLQIAATSRRARIITLIPGEISTRSTSAELPVAGGNWAADTAQDILKLAVIERHGRTGNIGIGFVQGFGIRGGALVSTVAHDSHNIVVVGDNDTDMLAAVRHVQTLQGGLAVVSHGQVLADLMLPIAGLISRGTAADVGEAFKRLHSAAAALGSCLESPFMLLSFLALPVIPELKLTDRGLVDVGSFTLVPVAIS